MIAVEEFEEWPLDQPHRVQVETAASIAVLAEFGPHFGRPMVVTIWGSAFDNMKELHYKVGKGPYRVHFAVGHLGQELAQGV